MLHTVPSKFPTTTVKDQTLSKLLSFVYAIYIYTCVKGDCSRITWVFKLSAKTCESSAILNTSHLLNILTPTISHAALGQQYILVTIHKSETSSFPQFVSIIYIYTHTYI